MKKRILKHSLKAIVAFFAILSANAYSQATISSEQMEGITSHWRMNAKDLKTKLGLSNIDFRTFVRFYQSKVDSDHIRFLHKVRNGKINESNVLEYLAAMDSRYIFLYKQFTEIKKEYPSSVSEFSLNKLSKPLNVCNPGCTNIDFENGTLSGWNAYYATNNSNSGFNITGVTGGACGSVQGAADDPLTKSTSSSGPDYQVEIMSGGTDPLAPSVSTVSPFGGKYSVRVGDSTNPNQGVAILNQTFMVTAANVNFTYQYAVFLENPGHPYYEQPFFNVALLDAAGDTIPHCGEYNVVSASGINGFKSVYYPLDGDSVYYKNWTVVFASLKAYIGQCVTIQFESADCALGGHFGYAYVDASCSPLGLISSSPAFCGQKTINLTAPPGGTQYTWTGPANGIVGQDTAQSISIDSAGTYNVIITPVTGKLCADTISITVPKAPGPVPVPFFNADTVCMGSATQFTNASNPLTGAGVKFYWNFNGLGTYQDSTSNPSYTFPGAGTYPVKLYEINNGCGTDTIINVKVDSNAVAAFTAANTCVGQTVAFTNTSTGAVSYSWNFGDGGASILTNPTHIYAAGGTYTVTLIAVAAGTCSDTVKKAITITPSPVVKVTGNDSICPGTTAILTATGATTYTWTGPSGIIIGNPISVSPASTATYTVSGSNGSCSGDTTFTVYVLTVPTPVVVTKPDTICVGGSSTLVASGGGKYTWSTSATTDSITVSPATTTTYTLTASNGKCSASATATVVVLGSTVPAITLLKDSICPGDADALQASGGVHYLWSTGATTTSIAINPTVTTPYYVIVRSQCFTDTLRQTVVVVPLPTPSISGNDSICAGTNTVLVASGGISGTKYSWSSGQVTSSIVVSPATQTTYTVTESNGACSATAVFTVFIRPQPNANVTRTCQDTAATLTVTGGGTYAWSTGQNTSTISIPTSPSSPALYVVVTKGCADTVKIAAIPGITACCDTTIAIGGTANIGATGAVGYVWSPSGTVNCFTCAGTTVSPTTNTTYTVVGTDASGNCSVAYVTVDIECRDFKVPNVFTPSATGNPVNKIFFIADAVGEPNYDIEIYDRWGVLMYKSTNPSNSWDGTTKSGADAPDGVYYYIIKSTCENNTYDKHGFVQIIR